MKSENEIGWGSHVAIIAPIIIGIGILKHIVFYSLFNVPITDFLEFNEVIVLFSDDLLEYLIIAVALYLIPFFSAKKGQNVKKNKFLLNYFKGADINERVVFYVVSRKWNMILLALIATVVVFQQNIKMKGAEILALLLLIDIVNLVIIITLFEVKRTLWIFQELKYRNRTIEATFNYFKFFIYIAVGWAVIEAKNIKHENKYINVSFTVDNEHVRSDSLKFYIGKTSKYLFFYNKSEDICTVYPMNRVTSMQFGDIIHINSKESK